MAHAILPKATAQELWILGGLVDRAEGHGGWALPLEEESSFDVQSEVETDHEGDDGDDDGGAGAPQQQSCWHAFLFGLSALIAACESPLFTSAMLQESQLRWLSISTALTTRHGAETVVMVSA